VHEVGFIYKIDKAGTSTYTKHLRINPIFISVFSDIHREEEEETCALLGYNTASSGIYHCSLCGSPRQNGSLNICLIEMKCLVLLLIICLYQEL
jgi:hypothetical protein